MSKALSKVMKKNGFTLVEVMVAISVLGIIGYVLVGVLTRSFSAGDKSQIIGTLKQNGQNIINTLEGNIQDSQAIVCLGSDSKIITIQKKDGSFARYYSKVGVNSGPGVIFEDHPNLKKLEDLRLSVDTKYFCDLTKVDYLPDKIALNDADLVNGSSIENLVFKINDSPGLQDSINISFDLKSSRDKKVVETFQTTIRIR